MADGPDPQAPLRARPRARRPSRRGILLERRRTLALVGLVVGGWLIFVFAGTASRSDALESEVAAARAQVEALQARLELGQEEVTFVRSEAFVEQAARSIGWGARGEVAFALEEGAPSPAPLPMLGAGGEGAVTRSPLEDLAELLTGS